MRASVLAALLFLSLAPSLSSAQVSDAAIAQQRFTRGRDLFDGGDYAAALEEFRAACSLSDSPNARLYLARSQAALHQYGDAMIAFELAERSARERASESPRYAETADAARTEREALAATLGRLVLELPSGPADVEVYLDGARLPAAALGLAIWVVPGSHAVEARAPGHTTASESVTVSAGAEAHLALTLTPVEASTPTVVDDDVDEEPPAAVPNDPTLSIVGGSLLGLGAVALGVAVPLWVLADDRFRALEQGCTPTCAASLRGVRDEGLAFEGASIGLLVGGAATLVVGGILVLIDAL